MELITVEQLSLKIHKSVQSIYNDLKRNPKSIPPVFRIKGSRRVLFANVDAWLLSQIQPNEINVEAEGVIELKPKRGRPTKSEQMTRTSRVGHASATRRNSTNTH